VLAPSRETRSGDWREERMCSLPSKEDRSGEERKRNVPLHFETKEEW